MATKFIKGNAYINTASGWPGKSEILYFHEISSSGDDCDRCGKDLYDKKAYLFSIGAKDLYTKGYQSDIWLGSECVKKIVTYEENKQEDKNMQSIEQLIEKIENYNSFNEENKKNIDVFDAKYAGKIKPAKYNFAVGYAQLNASEIRKQLSDKFKDWTKKDHMDAINNLDDQLQKNQNEYNKLLDDAAMEIWGRKYKMTDYKVSCIASDEFSDKKKNLLRDNCKLSNLINSAKTIHNAFLKGRN